MAELKQLKELCVSITDCPHSSPVWTETGKLVIRSNNIKDGRLDLSNPSYTDEEHFQDRIRRAIPEPGDLIITREAPMGEVCIIPPGTTCCLGQRMVLLKPDKQKIDNRYLLYALISSYVQRQIRWNEGTGTTVSNLRIPLLEQLSIPVPELEEQRRIADKLAVLDEQISINDKTAEDLDELGILHLKKKYLMAKLPFVVNENAEVDVPEGWIKTTIKEATVHNKRGFSPNYNKEDIGIPVVNQRCVRRHTIIEEAVQYHDFDGKEAPETVYLKPYDILVNSMGVGTLGRVAQVSRVDTQRIVHSCISILRANEKIVSPSFLGFFIRNIESDIEAMGTGSTGQTSLSNKALGEMAIMLPDVRLQKEDSVFLGTLLTQIDSLYDENRRLKELRTILLKKLVS